MRPRCSATVKRPWFFSMRKVFCPSAAPRVASARTASSFCTTSPHAREPRRLCQASPRGEPPPRRRRRSRLAGLMTQSCYLRSPQDLVASGTDRRTLMRNIPRFAVVRMIIVACVVGSGLVACSGAPTGDGEETVDAPSVRQSAEDIALEAGAEDWSPCNGPSDCASGSCYHTPALPIGPGICVPRG
jgi:hypothetical protein